MFQCYLAFGSNLGDRFQHLKAGICALNNHGVRIIRTASVYSTEPKEILSQPWFLNTVAEAETQLEPEMLLQLCLDIERSNQRKRLSPNGPRTLDIDIILFDDRIVDVPGLAIPHPRYAERRFVLTPLAEIASERLDPLRSEPVRHLLDRLEDDSSVNLFAPPLTIR